MKRNIEVDNTPLKPCKHCGRPGKIEIENDHHGYYFSLGCVTSTDGLSDGCPGASLFYTAPMNEKKAAIKKWNKGEY